MIRSLKYGLYFLAAIIAVLAAFMGYVAARFKPNDYKPLIVQQVQEKQQRTLKLDGDIKLIFFPRLGINLGKLSLSERNSPQEFASVESAKVYLSLLPLLRKKAVINRIRIDGAHVHLVRHPDGTSNIGDLLKKDEDAHVKFDIDSLAISRSALALDDEQSGRKLALNALEFRSGRLANGVATRFELNLDALSGRASGKLSLAGGLLFDLDRQHYRLEGLKLSLAGKQENNTLDIKLDAPKIDLAPGQAQGGKITLQAHFTRPGSHIDATLTLPGVEGTAKALRIGQAMLDLDGKMGENTLKGHLSTPLNGNLETRQFDLPELAAKLSVINPRFPGGQSAIALNGSASVDAATLRLQLDGHLDESAIQATFGLNRFAPPAYTFDITIGQIDLDRYLPPKPRQAAPEPEKPFDLSALKNLDASGKLRIGTLKASGFKSTHVRLELKADDARVQSDPLSGK